MPLLLNILQNANGPEYRKLRAKAMECAGLIGKSYSVLSVPLVLNCSGYVSSAIAVGRDIFRPDANTFVELLMRIQSMPQHPYDATIALTPLSFRQSSGPPRHDAHALPDRDVGKGVPSYG